MKPSFCIAFFIVLPYNLNMQTIEKTLEYHPLVMTLDDLTGAPVYELPRGYKFVFWQDDSDCIAWQDIHLSTGEFASIEEAEQAFRDYLGVFYNNLCERCLFIENQKGEKIATATVSPTVELGYNCVIDWLAISGKCQGRGLARPLISRVLRLARELGYDKIALHTQTHTWLAAKLYLDFGFAPYNVEDIRGWKILKTLTNHISLKDFQPLDEDFTDKLTLNIKSNLDKLHKDYIYSVWYINGRNDVFVNSNGKFYKYKFYDNGNRLELS